MVPGRVAARARKQNKAGGLESGGTESVLDEVITEGLWGGGIGTDLFLPQLRT